MMIQISAFQFTICLRRQVTATLGTSPEMFIVTACGKAVS